MGSMVRFPPLRAELRAELPAELFKSMILDLFFGDWSAEILRRAIGGLNALELTFRLPGRFGLKVCSPTAVV